MTTTTETETETFYSHLTAPLPSFDFCQIVISVTDWRCMGYGCLKSRILGFSETTILSMNVFRYKCRHICSLCSALYNIIVKPWPNFTPLVSGCITWFKREFIRQNLQRDIVIWKKMWRETERKIVVCQHQSCLMHIVVCNHEWLFLFTSECLFLKIRKIESCHMTTEWESNVIG